LLLVLNSEHGFWQFFHREIYADESPEEELRRELFEKTGINEFEFVRNFKNYIRLDLGPFQELKGFRGDSILFIMKINPETKINLNGTDFEDSRWIYPEELMDCTDYYPKVLDEILKEIKRIKDFPENINPEEFFI